MPNSREDAPDNLTSRQHRHCPSGADQPPQTACHPPDTPIKPQLLDGYSPAKSPKSGTNQTRWGGKNAAGLQESPDKPWHSAGSPFDASEHERAFDGQRTPSWPESKPVIPNIGCYYLRLYPRAVRQAPKAS